MQEYIENQLEELASGVSILKQQSAIIGQISEICTLALQNGHKIIFCGNGGSAAQSQHLAAELVGRYRMERPAMNSISLTVDTSNLTAIGNDYGYDTIFSRQLDGVGQAGDVLIGLSTSGNSQNIIKAFETAQQKKISTIAFVGASKGKMANIAEYTLSVPANTSAHIQEMHIACGHLICDLIERKLYGK